MTVYRNSAEGGINGTNVTISNSGGLSGDPFSIVTEAGLTDVLWADASALHGSKGIRIVPDGTNQAYVGFTFPALRLNTSSRFYFKLDAFPAAGGTAVIIYASNTANTGQRWAVRVSPAGIIQITNAATTQVFASATPIAINTIYRLEIAAGIGVGTITLRIFAGENITPIISADLTGQAIGGTNGAASIFFGYRTIVNGAGVLHIDDMMVDDDSLDLLGPASLSEIPLTAEFVGSGVVRLSWLMPPDAPNGISIARAPGLITDDGDGNPVHHPDYNPMTVPGAVMRATNVMSSPYLDSGVPLGSWTYWVARTAP